VLADEPLKLGPYQRWKLLHFLGDAGLTQVSSDEARELAAQLRRVESCT
jgi:hypothetical protein